ncbi:HNH endonuclease [Paenibacillus rhizophilus]|uniref:HNH endonuclease n=2 Tax=Paenibacillus rhizophilus TaxID=1850366 RepID=A0A3N9P3M0_9BACL|nr:HNH endonuclease [Paenibacillus rhizophilus]
MPHQTFWKPPKEEKSKKTSSLGRGRKEKKLLPEWKQNLFSDHTPGKSSADRAEFPPKVIKELIAEADGQCQHCKTAPDTTTHHVWPRGRGHNRGRGVKTNGLRLCGPCHDMIQTNEGLLQEWITIYREKYGDYFWYDEQDWEEHNRKLAAQEQAERERDERMRQIEPVADLVASAAGRPLRAKELRLIESFDTKALQVFTGMVTDALNGYAAAGHYRPTDRFED